MDISDIDEINLNEGLNQRMILVSAEFRKEVTSTILWLISKGVAAKCIQATLHSIDERLFIDFAQIIPVKDAEDYVIGMSSKNSEERETKTVILHREKLRLDFWEKMLNYFKEKKFGLYENISPSKDHWLNAGSGRRGCAFSLIFGKSEARTDLYLSSSDENENKELFDYLLNQKADIEREFGNELIWEPLDGKKACRIRFSKRFDGYNRENWDEVIEWIYNHIYALEKTMKPHLQNYSNTNNNNNS